jgi:hypothetical protein
MKANELQEMFNELTKDMTHDEKEKFAPLFENAVKYGVEIGIDSTIQVIRTNYELEKLKDSNKLITKVKSFIKALQ